MRWFAAGGILAAGAASWLQTFVMTTQTPFAALIATQALGGAGYAFIFVPLSVVIFRTVPQPSIPSALALTRLVQQIGASVGSAFAATLLDRDYVAARYALAPEIAPTHPAVTTFLATHGVHALQALDAIVAAQAMNLSAANVTQVFAIATMAAAVLPFLLARTQRPVVPNPLPRIEPTAVVVRGALVAAIVREPAVAGPVNR